MINQKISNLIAINLKRKDRKLCKMKKIEFMNSKFALYRSIALAVNLLTSDELSLTIALKLLNKSLVYVVNHIFGNFLDWIFRIREGEILEELAWFIKNKTMSKLSEGELARIARNRDKARNIKASKLCNHPYSRPTQATTENGENKPDTTKR